MQIYMRHLAPLYIAFFCRLLCLSNPELPPGTISSAFSFPAGVAPFSAPYFRIYAAWQKREGSWQSHVCGSGF